MKLLTRLQISKGPNWGGNLGLPDSTCNALNHHLIMPWRLKGQNKTMLIVQLECIQSMEMVKLMQYKWHEARNDLRDESQSITGHRVSHRQYHEPGRIEGTLVSSSAGSVATQDGQSEVLSLHGGGSMGSTWAELQRGGLVRCMS